jgi:VWFA-related protein
MRSSLQSSPWRLTLFSLVLVAALSVALRGSQGTAPPPAQPSRQMPPVTFRVEVNYVEVDAIVVDKKGDFVDNLQASDFRVFEDGKPQAITNFGLVQIPLERADAPLFVRQPIEPDIQSNVRPFDGRVYLIVLDELHTEPMHTSWVRAAARKFIQSSLGANDVAAVVSTQGSAAQDFTGNRRLLLAAVDRFMGNALRSATLNKIDNYNQTRGLGLSTGAPRDDEEMHRAYNASVTLRAIRELSTFMAGVRGRRKALVLFSEGIDYDIRDVINNAEASGVMQDTLDAIGAATRANVSVYSVDPRGLSAMAGFSADTAGPPIDADPSYNLDSRGMQDEMRLQHDSLSVLSDETGGFAAINSNDFTSAFDRIQKDNSTYYVLGYYPANERRDGRIRKIDVEVVNRPGVEVRYRKSYVAPRGKAPAEPVVEAKEGTPPVLRDLLGSPLPIPGLRLTAAAAAFKGTGSNASISLVVQADGRDLAFKEKDGKYEDTLDLAVIALDQQGGKSKGGLHHSLNMPLQPATYQQVVRNGLRITSRLDLPPGRYQLRIGVVESNAKRMGSVHYDLEVPDFTSAPLTMSGVVLTSSLAGQVRTAVGNADDDVRKAMPGPPTVSREFRSVEELALLAEIYDNERKTPHKVDITTSLRSDDGREVYKHDDERSSSELGGSTGGYGHTARIPLKGMSPGLYVLKVEARSRLGKGAIVSREVQIRIVP